MRKCESAPTSHFSFSVRIAPGAVVCDECELQGEIAIGMFVNITLHTLYFSQVIHNMACEE